jgi:hypothetical protein
LDQPEDLSAADESAPTAAPSFASLPSVYRYVGMPPEMAEAEAEAGAEQGAAEMETDAPAEGAAEDAAATVPPPPAAAPPAAVPQTAAPAPVVPAAQQLAQLEARLGLEVPPGTSPLQRVKDMEGQLLGVSHISKSLPTRIAALVVAADAQGW